MSPMPTATADATPIPPQNPGSPAFTSPRSHLTRNDAAAPIPKRMKIASTISGISDLLLAGAVESDTEVAVGVTGTTGVPSSGPRVRRVTSSSTGRAILDASLAPAPGDRSAAWQHSSRVSHGDQTPSTG